MATGEYWIHCATKRQNRSVTKCQLLHKMLERNVYILTQDWRCGRKATHLQMFSCLFPPSFLFRLCVLISFLYSLSFKFLPLLRYFPLFRLRCRSAEPSPREAMAHKESGHTSSPWKERVEFIATSHDPSLLVVLFARGLRSAIRPRGLPPLWIGISPFDQLGMCISPIF